MPHPTQPDEVDWKIIEILRKNHESNSAIARHLGVSEGMVRRRIQKLRDDGILRIRALIDPDVLSSELEGVLSVSLVSGRYDLLVEVLVDSNLGLVHFLTEQLSQVEGVSHTETFVVLTSCRKFV